MAKIVYFPPAFKKWLDPLFSADTVPLMGNPGAQHELACTLVQRYPHLTLRPGEIAGAKVPDHELAVAASNSHQLPNRPPLDGDDTRSFEERCFAIGMTDFSLGVPATAIAMLRETAEKDITIANLFFRTIAEEVSDVAMMEAVMQDDILEKLRRLKAWRDYEKRIEQRGEQHGQAKGETAAKADDLTQFFYVRGDRPSAHALDQIDACTSVRQLNLWLNRAYSGETAAEIFPEPPNPAE